MSSDPVIKYLNVFKDTPPGLPPALILLKIYEFRFQCMKERFHNGIVITVASRAHARYKTVLMQKVLKGITSVLGPAIGMKYQTNIGAPLSQGLLQCLVKNPLA